MQHLEVTQTREQRHPSNARRRVESRNRYRHRAFLLQDQPAHHALPRQRAKLIFIPPSQARRPRQTDLVPPALRSATRRLHPHRAGPIVRRFHLLGLEDRGRHRHVVVPAGARSGVHPVECRQRVHVRLSGAAGWVCRRVVQLHCSEACGRCRQECRWIAGPLLGGDGARRFGCGALTGD